MWDFANGQISRLGGLVQNLLQILTHLGKAITEAAYAVDKVKTAVLAGLKSATKFALNLLGTLGFDAIRDAVRRMICKLRATFAAVLRRFLAW